MNISLTALLLASFASHPSQSTSHALTSPTWNDVHAYLVAHAAPMDYDTESLLQAEAEAGVKTWIKCVYAGGKQAMNFGVLDGPGMGWPAAAHVLKFPTTGERDYAATLVDAVTASYRGIHR